MYTNDIEKIKQVIIALTSLKKGQYTSDYGVCGNLLLLGDFDLRNFVDYAKWDKYSGYIFYPIPFSYIGSNSKSAYNFHSKLGTLWFGKQKKLRMEFIDFCISELEETLKTNIDLAPYLD